MQAAIKLKTTVQQGHRVEFTAPELPEGADVELIVMLPEPAGVSAQKYPDVIAFLDSLTPVQRTPEEWAQVEREFHAERDSWDF